MSAYLPYLSKLATGGSDWESVDARVILLKGAGYTFDASHEFVSALTPASNEHDDDSYGRVAIANQAVSASGDTIRLTGDAAVFTALEGPDVTGVVVYEHVGADDSANPLIRFFAVSPAVSPNGQDLTVSPPADGWVRLVRVSA